jgi:colicin import membrane protein
MAIGTAANKLPNKFVPPPERFSAGSMGMAFLAHGFLIAALAWGTTWRSNNTIVTASAELWAELPVQAAPVLALPEPVPAEPIPERPSEKAPAIVTETTKVRDKPAPPKKDLKAEAVKKKEHETERQRELMRQEQLKRIMRQAGSGSPSSAGSAQMTAGQKADYDAFIRSIISPNINYQNSDFEKTPLVTEVIFEIAVDGSILRPRVYKTSGNKDWDAVAVRALEKTNMIPRDRKGFRPDSLIAQVKPRGQ